MSVVVEVSGLKEQAGELSDRETYSVLRRRYGITQTQVARAAGVTQSKISAWEHGGWLDEKSDLMWTTLVRLIGDRLPAAPLGSDA